MAKQRAKQQPKVEAITLSPHVWRCVVGGVLQRPTWNSKGAALTFGIAVAQGHRKPEPAL